MIRSSAFDGRSHGWDHASPASNMYGWEPSPSPDGVAFTYFTPPMSNGSFPVPAPPLPMIASMAQSRFIPGPTPLPPPPGLPIRHVMPYAPPPRGFWTDQFNHMDVHRQDPLPQDWHPFVDVAAEQTSQPTVSGGVMTVLDYDLRVMAQFVANVSCNFINVREPWEDLIMFVEKVLNQTRLPSSTVILAITYLSKRLSVESPYDDDPSAPLIPTTHLRLYLTLSLLLANKFLDDNTFTNTSWSDITGFSRQELNVAERKWLNKLGYSLHVDPTEKKGWSTWRKAWETWQFDVTGMLSPLLTPVLSRSNSSISHGAKPSATSSAFPSMSTGAPAYLTPPISPTFDDSNRFSPMTPPVNYPWSQVSWQPLPNSRNVPVKMFNAFPLSKQYPQFYEPEKGATSQWCDCNGCRTNSSLSFDHRPHRTRTDG